MPHQGRYPSDNPVPRMSSPSRRAGASIVALLLVVWSLRPAAYPEFLEYPLPSPNSQPYGIALGADGNMWFAEGANRIGRITPGGVITEFTIPTSASEPRFLALGADGNMWFTESAGNQIGRITTAGVITEFPLPNAGAVPFGITAGPDGALWFTEQAGNRIGRITTAGVITEFDVPTASSAPTGITSGPDGNLWFTERDAQKIGSLTPGSGAIAEFASGTGSPLGIVSTGTGLAYVLSGFSGVFGTMTTSGVRSTSTLLTGNSQLSWMASAAGTLWATGVTGNVISRVTPRTAYVIPTAGSAPYGIAGDASGQIWFTESTGNAIGRLRTGTGSAPTTTLTYGGTAVSGTPFTSMTESGFTTTADAVGWTLTGTLSAASIQFRTVVAPETRSVRVTQAGSLFRFYSADLYSSVSVIPYTFTGWKGGVQQFSISGTIGNTYGNFVTATNAKASDSLVIDALDIFLTDPNSGNAVGVDNVVVCRAFGSAPVPQVTVVRATDVLELRERIDAQRLRFGLTAYTWTGSTPTAGATRISAQHVADLRTALNEAYVAHAQTPPTYTDPVLATGATVVKAAHIAELRTAVEVLEGACFRLP